MSTQIIEGANGGALVTGGPVTTSIVDEASPGLLSNTIDERIVRVRPMSTPIDQLSRCGEARSCGSMKVEYYAVDTKKTEVTLAEDAGGRPGTSKAPGVATYIVSTDGDEFIEVSETLLMPDVRGTSSDEGSVAQGLVLYVVSKPDAGGVEVVAVNGMLDTAKNDGSRILPSLLAGQRIVRMGRAATELDVQTAQFAALPVKNDNNCQIFKMQVEESTFHKIADKEVGWSFSDREEAAIIDMRLGMEKNFIFGAKSAIFDPVKRETVYLTGGIWNQTPREAVFNIKTPTEGGLVTLCSEAFTQNAGSKRKILIAGTKMMEALSRIDYGKVVSSGETIAKWGIEFKEIRSNFGSLYVIHSEIFDQCGHASDGFILDPDYITKYVHMPFHAEKLDLRRSGVRNTDAVVITECSCLVLRYPQSHLRVKGITENPAKDESKQAAV